jgi:hypothetical protein
LTFLHSTSDRSPDLVCISSLLCVRMRFLFRGCNDGQPSVCKAKSDISFFNCQPILDYLPLDYLFCCVCFYPDSRRSISESIDIKLCHLKGVRKNIFKATTLGIPRRVSISRPTAPISSVAGGYLDARPRIQGTTSIF